MTEVVPLAQQVTCHAWNKDLSMIALSPNTDEIHIYATNKSPDNSANGKENMFYKNTEVPSLVSTGVLKPI